MISNIKNIFLTCGMIVTVVAISATPHMVKWLLSTYIIFSIALCIGNGDDKDL